jgi:hypothetical protein
LASRTTSRCYGRGRWSGSRGGLCLELFVVVALNRTPSHDGRADALLHDVLLFILVEGSLHAFDVDWF